MVETKSLKSTKRTEYLSIIIFIVCFPLLLLGQTDTTTSTFTGTTTDVKPEGYYDLESDTTRVHKKEIIAVLNFSPNGIIKLEAEVLTNQFAIELNKTEKVIVYDRVGLKEIASQKGIDLENCVENKCFSQLASLLEVSKIIYGKIEKLDEFEYINGKGAFLSPFAISASMIDVKADTIFAKRDKRFTGDAEDLMNEVQITAWEILGLEVPQNLLKKRSGETGPNSDATLVGTVLRSALLPGLGQLYMGQDLVGYFWMGSGLTIGLLAYNSYDKYKKAYDDVDYHYDNYLNAMDPQSIKGFRNLSIQAESVEAAAAKEAEFMLSLGLGLYIANIVHAVMIAPTPESKSGSAKNKKTFFDFIYNKKLKQPQLRFSIALD